MKLTRRQFMKGLGAVAVAPATALALPDKLPDPLSEDLKGILSDPFLEDLKVAEGPLYAELLNCNKEVIKGAGYKKQEATFGFAKNGMVALAEDIYFPRAIGMWESICWIAISNSEGIPLVYYQSSQPRNLTHFDQFVMKKGTYEVSYA